MKNIEIYWVSVNETQGRIETIILPNDEKIFFNDEEDKIDFDSLTPYIGHPCDYYNNGELVWSKKLIDIGYTPGEENGRPDLEQVRTLFFEEEPQDI